MRKKKKSNSELEEIKAKLKDMELRYEDALLKLDQSKQGANTQSIAGLDQKVIQVDSKLNILYVNPPMVKILGVSKEELKGMALQKVDNLLLGPGYLEVMLNQCKALKREIVKDRTYFDKDVGQEVAIRISATQISQGFQILLEDRTKFLALEKKFGRYVSPKVWELMKERGTDFDIPRKYELTVLFVDLRGFTALSEKMTPENVRETINPYLEGMFKIVDSNDAMVDKIVGDEVMVLCGAPIPREDHALQAVKISLEMIKTQESLVKKMGGKGQNHASNRYRHKFWRDDCRQYWH